MIKQTENRLRCPMCGVPTIDDDGHNTPDMALCNFCYQQEAIDNPAPSHTTKEPHP